MQFWIIQTLNSLALGGLLFLLASGFSLIFGLMRLANLSHGAFFMLGAYLGANILRNAKAPTCGRRRSSPGLRSLSPAAWWNGSSCAGLPVIRSGKFW